MSRCDHRVPPTSGASEGLAFTKPHYHRPGARCELEAGHGEERPENALERRHRAGLLLWWDPPLIVRGGRGVST